jgi:hypothetical protein
METDREGGRKYVFVCGLQRSGTSVLARNLARLADCTAFKDTGVLQDEGQYLQDVYLPDGAYGGTGRYGFDPRAHLTENSPLLTSGNIAKLHASWHRYWDNSKSIFLEKTPANLIMSRFLQAAFPNSYFVVIRRHPVPVSMATARWKISMTSIRRLFEHWLHCHDLFESDRPHLRHVYDLRYEDYVQNSAKFHREIGEFIGASVPETKMEEVTDAHNKRYFDRWANLLIESPLRGYYRYVAQMYEPRFARYNYSLLAYAGLHGVEDPSIPFRTLGEIYCLAADAGTLVGRVSLRAKWELKKQLRARLPDRLKDKLKPYIASRPADARNTSAN